MAVIAGQSKRHQGQVHEQMQLGEQSRTASTHEEVGGPANQARHVVDLKSVESEQTEHVVDLKSVESQVGVVQGGGAHGQEQQQEHRRDDNDIAATTTTQRQR